MWHEFLLGDAFWFWTLVVVQSGLVIWFVRNDSVVGAVLSVLSILAGLAFFPSQWESVGLGEIQAVGFWVFLKNHVGVLLAGIGSYLLIGVAWAAFQWWLYVKSLREVYDQRKLEWLQPSSLLNTAHFLHMQSVCVGDDSLKHRYGCWANACAEAAARGGRVLTSDLKPVWKEFVEHGYRF